MEVEKRNAESNLYSWQGIPVSGREHHHSDVRCMGMIPLSVIVRDILIDAHHRSSLVTCGCAYVAEPQKR